MVANPAWWIRAAGVVVVAGLSVAVTSCGNSNSLSAGHQPVTGGTDATASTQGSLPGTGPVTTSGSESSTSEDAGGSMGTATVDSGTVATSTPTSQAPQPTATTTTVAPSPPPGNGAYGYLTAGPTCPVEQAGHPCPPDPVSAELDARDAAGITVGTTRSDSSGRYALSLRPGSYTLVVVTGSGGPRCPNTAVTVASGQPTRADIACDTGIR
jgi:hypothetical protein